MVIKGAKEVEQGSAAVAELSRPGKKDAANAFIAVATEEAAAVGGKSEAAADRICAANAEPQLRSPLSSQSFR